MWVITNGEIARVPATAPDAGAGPIAWSPDSARIVFHSNRDGDCDLYVVDVNEEDQEQPEPQRLTTTPGYDAEPAWSPDGERIAYRSSDEVCVINADGSERLNLTGHPGRDAEPSWCRDGGYLVFRTNRDGNDEIYMMDDKGEYPVNLTVDPASDRYPCWR